MQRIIILIVLILSVLSSAAILRAPEAIPDDTVAIIRKYTHYADSVSGVLARLVAEYEASPESGELVVRMTKISDKIAEIEAVVEYLRIDRRASSDRELIATARKLINTLRPKLAVRLLRGPAERGNSFALNFVGMRDFGEGRHAEGLAMMRRAADAGYAPAIHNVAVALYNGRESEYSSPADRRLRRAMMEAYLTLPIIRRLSRPGERPYVNELEYLELDDSPMYGDGLYRVRGDMFRWLLYDLGEGGSPGPWHSK